MNQLASWNINGLRGLIKKDGLFWKKNSAFDIICLQEVKAQESDIDWAEVCGDQYFFSGSFAEKRGYSGVVTLAKKHPHEIITAIGDERFDSEGRFVAIRFGTTIIINTYVPNGQRDHKRVPFKMEFKELLKQKLLEFQAKGYSVIICGDINTAHEEIDLANPKSNKNTTGFLPVERQWMDGFFRNHISDVFREQHPSEAGHYTWWSQRGDCRARNIGWRIDYILADKTLAPQLKSAKIHPEIFGSDHCPISVQLPGV